MNNKSNGLFTFLTGAITGAAAVFFANKSNRVKTQKVVDDLTKQANKFKEKYEKNPQEFKEEVIRSSKHAAAQISSKTSKAANKASMAADKASKALEPSKEKKVRRSKPRKIAVKKTS